MSKAMIDFVFNAPKEDNQKFLEYLEMVKQAKNCIESYKIRFDYSVFYVHVSVLKQEEQISMLGGRVQEDTKIIIRNKKNQEGYVHLISFKDLCFFNSLDWIVNSVLKFNKTKHSEHYNVFIDGI